MFVLQYYGLISGDITVNDAGAAEWFNYSNDGKVLRKQVDMNRFFDRLNILSGILTQIFSASA